MIVRYDLSKDVIRLTGFHRYLHQHHPQLIVISPDALDLFEITRHAHSENTFFSLL